MSAEDLRTEINKLLTQLTEQVPDAHIQVLATWNSGGNSHSVHTGVGNWYARQGLAHEFINADVAQENARQLAERINPDKEP